MREITYQQLVRANACADQIRLFKRLFGDAVVPTDALVQQHGHLFDSEFAAENLLPKKQWEQYKKAKATLLEQYEKAVAPLLEQYDKAKAPLWEQYEKAVAPLLEQYDKAVAPLWEQYEKARDALWEQYEKDRMAVFVKLYQQGE